MPVIQPMSRPAADAWADRAAVQLTIVNGKLMRANNALARELQRVHSERAGLLCANDALTRENSALRRSAAAAALVQQASGRGPAPSIAKKIFVCADWRRTLAEGASTGGARAAQPTRKGVACAAKKRELAAPTRDGRAHQEPPFFFHAAR